MGERFYFIKSEKSIFLSPYIGTIMVRLLKYGEVVKEKLGSSIMSEYYLLLIENSTDVDMWKKLAGFSKITEEDKATFDGKLDKLNIKNIYENVVKEENIFEDRLLVKKDPTVGKRYKIVPVTTVDDWNDIAEDENFLLSEKNSLDIMFRIKNEIFYTEDEFKALMKNSEDLSIKNNLFKYNIKF